MSPNTIKRTSLPWDICILQNSVNELTKCNPNKWCYQKNYCSMRYLYPSKVSQWTNKNATLTNGGIKGSVEAPYDELMIRSRSPYLRADPLLLRSHCVLISSIEKNIYSQYPLIQGFSMKKVFKLDFDQCFLLQRSVNCCKIKIALKFLWIWNMYIIKSQILQTFHFLDHQ